MKEFLLILISIPVVSIAQIGTTHNEADQHHKKGIAMVGQLSNILADSIAADSTGMSTLNSVDFAKAMVPGWNVGNSLEADGGETGWGNPLISQTLIDSIKAAGFKAIRIPVAWGQHSDTSFTINSNWIARVEQVINFVLKDSMYAIINEHWDNGWILPTY